MTVFYQHIGEQLWFRDAPRSIGTREVGVKRFQWKDIEAFLGKLEPAERLFIRTTVNELAPTGFQIWGVPTGAQPVLASMSTGDFLMLLESHSFAYAGQVLHRVSEPLWDLSTHIWGEGRFPLIVFLQGELINYLWEDFTRIFNFDPKYHMRGNTMRLKAERIAESGFKTEEAFIAQLATTTGVTAADLETDFRAFGSSLQSHYRQIKQRAQQRKFRQDVMTNQGHACAVCDLAIPSILDAAHIVEKVKNGTDDPRNGLLLCALHHRMFDSGLFVVHPASLKLSPLPPYTLADLRITRSDISHLPNKPHKVALDLRWKHLES